MRSTVCTHVHWMELQASPKPEFVASEMHAQQGLLLLVEGRMPILPK